ncbi:MAG TPA: M14 family metallopeptidase [Terriglobales bacterium]|nr:M14 family metallopeptidase [Terriglobales bacterium]
MLPKRSVLPLVALLALASGLGAAVTFDKYHSPAEVVSVLQAFAQADPAAVKLHKLATSPGGREVVLVEVGPEVAKTAKTVPAVFVGANFEGLVPISGEGALYLVKQLIDRPELRKDLTWYVLPCPNPDAAARFFGKPLYADPRNLHPSNDDMDDAVDEDGYEDLDGNGIITMMRVKDPAGEWMPVPGEPRLMKKADWSKGEKGVYKLYTEGIDNDGDGEYNEDGPGGVNIGVQFPHLFHPFTPESGPWAGSEPESFAVIKFVNEHPEIGLTFVYGSTNFCLNPPRGGRKGDADLNQIKIPENMAGFIGADPNRTYTMAEVMDMVKPLVPEGMQVTESMIASFLGLGAVVNPLPEDLKFYKELSDKYKDFLKKAKLDDKRLEPAQDKDGSFELYAYYQLGLPSFSLDFWTLPEVKEEKKEADITPEKLEKMTNDEFIALGEEKVDAFLKASGAPAQFKAKQLFEGLKAGQMTTKQMAEMMRQMPKPPSEEGTDPKEKALLAWSDKELGGKGFVAWKPFKHPQLGDAEIGGAVPFTDTTPPAAKVEPLLKGQVPWTFEVAAKMARIRLGKTAVKPLGGGVYAVEAWVENAGYLPYPTAMGRRNNRNLPVIVTLEGKDVTIVEGKKRSLVQAIDGNSAQQVRWLVRSEKPAKIEIKALTRLAWGDARTLDLGGAK